MQYRNRRGFLLAVLLIGCLSAVLLGCPPRINPVLVEVPDLTALSLTESYNQLIASNLVVGTITEEYHDSLTAGLLITQSPAHGTMTEAGSSISLTFSKGPAPVAVPDLMGLSQPAAEVIIGEANLVLGAITETYHESIPLGIVLFQNPSPGTMLQPQSTVSLILSKGPKPISVPSLLGMTQEDAIATLTLTGLSPGTITEAYDDFTPADRIISQHPIAGSFVQPGTGVAFVIAKGREPVPVPNVIGLSRSSAMETIVDGRLTVGTIVETYNDNVPENCVISQEPVPGGIVLSGSSIALSISKGPFPIAVPNVAGMSQSDASTAILASEFTLGLISNQYSNSVPLGNVIRQNPVAGSMQQPGDAISLVISDGPAPIAVPDVVGMSQSDALTAILASELTLGVISNQYNDSVPLGFVIRQNPVAGSIQHSGDAISLVISDGPAPIAVPDVVGMTQSDASTAILASEFTLGLISNHYSDSVPLGYVIRQNPVAGSMQQSGDAISLVISDGPAPIAVPNVTGMLQSLAEAMIEAAGMLIGEVHQIYHESVSIDNVINQHPAAGSLLLPGSAVALLVSKGPEPIPVPNVVGMIETEAITTMMSSRFTVLMVIEEYSDTTPYGVVCRQDPDAGTFLVPGSGITLFKSKGPAPIPVPDLVGLSLPDAETALTNSGFLVGVITEANSGLIPLDHVIQQDPAPGTPLHSGDEVDLLVSLGAITWEHSIGSTDLHEIGYRVRETSDGGFIVAGEKTNPFINAVDVYLLKTDSFGNPLWSVLYEAPENESARSIRETVDGGFIIVGDVYYPDEFTYDIFMMKTDVLGNQLWIKYYGGAENDYAYSVLQAADGDFIIAGRTASFGQGKYDGYLIRTDSQGELIWARAFGNSNNDVAKSVIELPDGSLVVTGQRDDGYNEEKVYLLKTDAFGNTIWMQSFPIGNYILGEDVKKTVDGGFIILGKLYWSQSSMTFPILIRTDEEGEYLWSRSYREGESCGGYSVEEMPNGGFMVAGWAKYDSPFRQAMLLKTDDLGNTIWVKTFGGEYNEEFYSMQLTSDISLIVTGVNSSYNRSNRDIYLMRTDAEGNAPDIPVVIEFP